MRFFSSNKISSEKIAYSLFQAFNTSCQQYSDALVNVIGNTITTQQKVEIALLEGIIIARVLDTLFDQKIIPKSVRSWFLGYMFKTNGVFLNTYERDAVLDQFSNRNAEYNYVLSSMEGGDALINVGKVFVDHFKNQNEKNDFDLQIVMFISLIVGKTMTVTMDYIKSITSTYRVTE